MATESNLQKIHVFPSEESYEQNQGSIGADDIAFVPDDSGGSSGGSIPVVTTGGTGAAYTATVPGVTELTVGLAIIIIPHTWSESTEPTLNVNNLGAKKMLRVQSIGDTYGRGAKASWIGRGAAYLLILSENPNNTGELFWNVVGIQRTFSSDIYVSTGTDYTANKVRGIALKTSTPSSIPNGCIVGVYEA